MYFSPFIDATGYHMPAYSDIRDQMIADATTIFGSNIYLGIDSQDYQWISAVSSIIYDSFLASQYVYNTRGPSTAVGSPLDVIVKINGIKRTPAVYSTCYVTLTGSPAATITNGIIGDVNGNKWNLPSPITLDGTGASAAYATCQISGPIIANIGELNKIVTPTYGWTAVTNSVESSIGAYVEPDAALRSRQAVSTAQPSRTVLEGTKGAIAAVGGVTRFIVYENDTNTVDANGLPAHSITAVVEGGDNTLIATAIFEKKGPGCYTNGTTPVVLTDAYGNPTTIRFYRPTYVDIDVVINVKALVGYTSDTTATVKSLVAQYISSLSIGDDLSVSSLWGASLGANTVPSKPILSITGITASKHGGSLSTADIDILFNEVTRGNTSYITVNVT